MCEYVAVSNLDDMPCAQRQGFSYMKQTKKTKVAFMEGP